MTRYKSHNIVAGPPITHSGINQRARTRTPMFYLFERGSSNFNLTAAFGLERETTHYARAKHLEIFYAGVFNPEVVRWKAF